MPISLLNLIALACFLLCWVGYTYFAKKKAKTTNCIAKCLHQHRIHWMYEVFNREIKVGEAALLANLERNIAFFASSTLLVLAGVLTLFAQAEQLEDVIKSIPYAEYPVHGVIQFKLGLLAFIFVFAFFQFTWSMRQYGFLNVMIGAAPYISEDKKMLADSLNENLQGYAKQMATVQDQAAHSYNYGLRSYYFSISAICWFFHPILFIIASVFVVYTLFMREFRSKAVKAITAGQAYLKIERIAREKEQRKNDS